MKKVHLGVAIVALSVLLSACGSGTKAADESKNAEKSTKPEQKELSLTIGLPGAYDVTKKEIIDAFIQKFPHIKVTIQEAPWGDFVTKITTQIAGGNAPDVWFQENAVILGYGKRGVAEDLAPYIKRDLKENDYVPALLSAKTQDGKVWGIPHDTNPIALAYNKKIFQDANMAVPNDNWTFQELIAKSKALTKKPDVYGFNLSSNITQGWFPWIKQAGGTVLDATLTKAAVNNPKTLDGLNAMYTGVKEGYFTSPDFVKASGGDWQTFGNGKAAMYFVQYNVQVLLNKNFPDLDWDVVKIPKGSDGKRIVPMVTNSWLVYSKAKPEAKEAAWEFLKFYLGEEAQTILANSGSGLPVYKKAMESVEKNTVKPINKKAFTEGIAEGGTTLDENASWKAWVGVFGQYVTKILTGAMTPEEAVKEAQIKIQDAIDSN